MDDATKELVSRRRFLGTGSAALAAAGVLSVAGVAAFASAAQVQSSSKI